MNLPPNPARITWYNSFLDIKTPQSQQQKLHLEDDLLIIH